MSVDHCKAVHPFFKQTSGEQRPEDVRLHEQRALKKRRGRPPKSNNGPPQVEHDPIELSIDAQDRDSKFMIPQVDGHEDDTATLQPDPSPHKRKRRKITEQDRQPNGKQSRVSSSDHADGVSMTEALQPPCIPSTASPSEVGIASNAIIPLTNRDTTHLRPTKDGAKSRTLHLNGEGGLGSPPQGQQEASTQQDMSNPKRRRRKRAVFVSKIVVIRYGQSNAESRSSIGKRIEEMLSSTTDQPKTRSLDSVPILALAINPLKPTHPFFSAKTTPKPTERDEQKEKVVEKTTSHSRREPPCRSFTTPIKPRREVAMHRDAGDTLNDAEQYKGRMNKSGLKTRGPPGPPWPWHGFNARYHQTANLDSGGNYSLLRGQKFKRKRAVPETETLSLSWLHKDAQEIVSTGSPNMSTMTTNKPHPNRLVETEASLKERIRQRLPPARSSSALSTGSYAASELAAVTSHPALQSLYNLVGKELHAFDRNECENVTWLHKYAPRKAEHVLQAPHEMAVLRNWLGGLTVDYVEKRLQQKQYARSSSPQRAKEKARRKKRRKRDDDDLGGFLASSDEEEDEMQSLADGDLGASLDKQVPGTRSVIRSGDANIDALDPRKVMNAVVLSGPAGCGKTAAAYAVAQELGFNVFEINSTTRRSGRDILDKVGDMSLNHQVKKSQDHPEAQAQDLDSELFQEAEVGQNTLTSFFAAGAKKQSSKKTAPPRKETKSPSKGKGQVRAQKQSLILLEEVDVLFEDDKQFWETVVDLAKQSRRPIIMTCNDEATIPLESMSLHAILRLQPPSADHATTFLSLLAAAEGHLIDPANAKILYETSGLDLRSSINHLNFWCQMTVGSDKGGLDWYLRRWPVGRDINSAGQQLHIVSNHTYDPSLDLPQQSKAALSEDDHAMQAWMQWGIDPIHSSRKALDAMVVDSKREGVTHSSRDQGLHFQSYEHCLDLLSSTDTISKVDHPSAEDNLLDLTLPPLLASAHNNYTSDVPLLFAEPLRDHQSLGPCIYTALNLGVNDIVMRMRRHADTPEEEISTAKHPEARTLLKDIIPCSDMRPSRPEYLMPLHPLIEDPIDALNPGSNLSIDIAPYARSIVAYDLALEEHREKLAKVFAGNKSDSAGARLRKTRASRSALEGSQRSSTRRERWFNKDVDYAALLATAGPEWPRVEADMVRQRQEQELRNQEGSDCETRLASSQSSEGS